MIIPVRTICEQIKNALSVNDFKVGDIAYTWNAVISWNGQEYAQRMVEYVFLIIEVKNNSFIGEWIGTNSNSKTYIYLEDDELVKLILLPNEIYKKSRFA